MRERPSKDLSEVCQCSIYPIGCFCRSGFADISSLHLSLSLRSLILSCPPLHSFADFVIVRERESGLFLLSFPCFVHSCRVDRSWMWLLLCFLFDIAVGFVHVVYVFCCLVSCFSVWHMSMEWRICVVRIFAIVFQGPVVLARLSFDVFAGRFWT